MTFDSEEEEPSRKKRQSRKTKLGPDAAKLTEDSLREAALGYLDRQDASVEQVRRCLRRRVFRYGDEEIREEAHSRIEEILSRLQLSRVLDDDRFAIGLATSLRRRGASLPKVRQKLLARGIRGEQVEAGIALLDGDEELSDEASALIYARKRRLRERYDLTDPKQRNKALASLARQGFSFEMAKKVLEV
jgi:regulatory protein